MTNGADTAQWPAKAVDPEGADLVAPITTLLDQLGLLKAPEKKPGEATAGVIESTTLEVTNTVTSLLRNGGALAGVAAAAGSIWAGLAEQPLLAAVAIGGAAVVLAAVALGLAMVVNGDVRGRAAVTTEQLASKGLIAKAYLEALAPETTDEPDSAPGSGDTAAVSPPSIEDGLRTALATYGNDVTITTTDGQDGQVMGLKWDATRGLRIRLEDDWIDVSEVATFSAPAS